MTLVLTVGGALLAFVVAVILGLMARQDNIWIRGTARVIIEFFRGSSLVVQLFFLFYVFPLFGIDLPPMLVGVLALGLNYGAYGAEVVRGSINAVPTGQWEATVALSLGRWQRMTRVIFPQAWALMLPSLNNLLILLLKGTAIVSFITLADLTFVLGQLQRDTSTFFAYTLGLIIYFVLAYIFTLLMNGLEVRAKRKLGMGASLKTALKTKTEEDAA